MEPIKIDYCDITSQLDAREILRYLNNLGIKNISGEALKCFITVIKVPIQPIKKKNDPVSLYHYYTSLWAKYKSNVPGENNWSDLRWSIRQKMVGNTVSQTSNKVTDQHPNVHKKQNTA
ncbi:hypothetical protein KGM_213684 [Danaus plexippus plexippus]|uniref:Centriolar and ciliogenesis-associated protein HYLS1 C-terminal domain-containing protein n=1 Tax=Danaus plexippus plexippus TaxID=278856 RepID=A0A212FLF5_DANPL|nr:hypothetical protein KGM_213684 [Danaus plexippus plexippus]